MDVFQAFTELCENRDYFFFCKILSFATPVIYFIFKRLPLCKLKQYFYLSIIVVIIIETYDIGMITLFKYSGLLNTILHQSFNYLIFVLKIFVFLIHLFPIDYFQGILLSVLILRFN